MRLFWDVLIIRFCSGVIGREMGESVKLVTLLMETAKSIKGFVKGKRFTECIR